MSREACRGLGGAGELLGEGFERGERKEELDRDAEEAGDFQGEFQGGAVVAALEIADGLEVDPDRLGQLLAGDRALGAEKGDPVEHGVVYTQ